MYRYASWKKTWGMFLWACLSSGRVPSSLLWVRSHLSTSYVLFLSLRQQDPWDYMLGKMTWWVVRYHLGFLQLEHRQMNLVIIHKTSMWIKGWGEVALYVLTFTLISIHSAPYCVYERIKTKAKMCAMHSWNLYTERKLNFLTNDVHKLIIIRIFEFKY